MPRSHQAAQPCSGTSSTFPQCTRAVFPGRDVILSCQLTERPGGSCLEWCSGYKRLSQTPYLLIFFIGKRGSATAKETAAEVCNVAQTHLLVVLPSMLWLVAHDSTPETKLVRGPRWRTRVACWPLPGHSLGETVGCADLSSASFCCWWLAHALQVP